APPTHGSGQAGVLSRFRRPRKRGNAPDGCDPKVFAEQIAEYLERAAAERALWTNVVPNGEGAIGEANARAAGAPAVSREASGEVVEALALSQAVADSNVERSGPNGASDLEFIEVSAASDDADEPRVDLASLALTASNSMQPVAVDPALRAPEIEGARA